MKKAALLLVFLVVVSSPASAIPYAGTWYSNQGLDRMETGTWTESLQGAPLFYVGSTGSMTSSGGQWSCAIERTGGEYIAQYAAVGLTYYDVAVSFANSKFDFRFFDGNDYSAMLDCTASYTMFFNGQEYQGSSVITWIGHGVIEGYPNYMVNLFAIGRELVPSEFSHSGSIDYVKMSISDPKVPIPAALWVFGSGLIGLIGLRKRAAGA